jgi:hypothetical protein
MKYSFKYVLCILPALTFASCKKPYNPPAIASPGSYLVVEGVINAGADSTVIKLSRTVSLSNANALNPVVGAVVAVQSGQNAVYPLTGTGKGNYVSAGLNLNNSQTYRLSIKTNNEQYYSDYVPVLNSPAIDSLYFKVSANGINIYSATHDLTNTVKYFRWDYQETWIIHSPVNSGFISNGDTVLTRTPSQQIFTCWRTDTSRTIIWGSSAKLAADVIVDNPVTNLLSSSPKIANEYSILLRQYALTADAYNFWTNLKTTTEQLGSIFDAQPSEINGNIHSATDPSEPVIGYISVGATTSRRIFITSQQLPGWPFPYPNENYPADCTYMACLYTFYPKGSSAPVNQVNEYINYDKGATNPLIPIDPIQNPGGPILGYTAGSPACVDCTLQGGTNIQPAYWKY